MTYSGRVQGGAIVIDGDDKPAEGSVLRIETIELPQAELSQIAKTLLSLSGIIEDGPVDGSINVDHYLYGLPKKNG